MRTSPLDQGWSLHLPLDQSIPPGVPPAVSHAAAVRASGVPATVPGTVHTDLMAAGLIEDPCLDDAEARLRWIGACDWAYRTTVTLPPFVVPAGETGAAERLDLVLEGVDTLATITLDGRELARTANMHRTHRLDARELLDGAPRDLVVRLASPVRGADAASVALGVRPQVGTHPFNAVRKMACSFGWDWGPDLATSGLWRPASLEAWSTARLAGVRPLVTVDDVAGARPTGRLAVHVDVERSGAPGSERALVLQARLHPMGGDPLVVSARLEPGALSAVLEIDVPDVALWWPVGHGGQPRYLLEVSLDVGREEGVTERWPDGGPVLEPWHQGLDVWHGSVGFRTIALDTSPDTAPSGPHAVMGSRTTLVVNGRPVFVRGVNWIPDDVFPHRVDRDRCAARADQALEAGANLLRVWGGGIYESDDLYDVCSERGLMVWQDFAFACAAYAEEEPLRSEVEAEVRDNVARLVPHASLVLWAGCNENLWGHEDWGWRALLDGRTWGEGYYHDLLPRVLAELDPHRPYVPGSPFSSREPVSVSGLHPNDDAHGTSHLWEQWNSRDHTTYREHAPRFAAELGWQAPPTMATLRRAVHDDPLTPESPGMLAHQKAVDGSTKLAAGLVPHFRVPDAFDDWHWATSLNQARAVTTAVEHLRSLSPHCSGVVWWQLNDCWPVTSWSVVDGDGRAKPAFQALKRSYAPLLLTIQPRGERLALVVVDDTDEAFETDVEVTRRRLDGTVVAAATLAVAAAARSTAQVALPIEVSTAGDERAEVLVAQVVAADGARPAGPGDRALWFFAEDRDLAHAAHDDALTATAHRVGDHQRVDLVASALVRDVAVLADRVDPSASADTGLLTLLPGELASIHVRAATALDPQALLAREVLRSANQLVAGAPSSA